MIDNFILLKDFYKVGHHEQYPEKTEAIFSNLTPRKSLLGTDYAVLFGIKYFIEKYLNFDYLRKIDIRQYAEVIEHGLQPINKDYSHMKELEMYISVYGKLPIEIYSLPELSKVPIGVPALVVFNTDPRFYWVPNMIETILSSTIWGPSTSATIASIYRKLLDQYAHETSDIPEFVDFQAHDFSFRGMYGLEAAILSGAAHLQYFKGTDTIPSILFVNQNYGQYDRGFSVPATEHSVMCAGGKENELETYKRLINDIYPSGIVSIVSDTWDLWNVIDNYLPILKEDIMKRNGKVVIRPDSGDPVNILCGSDSEKGLIERLWDIFGGTVNSKRYKQLDSHIGAIYGDSITYERARKILEKLKEKGFSSTNVVFGIGSYTYQYNTRDSLGWAMKATAAKINGEWIPIFKDPKTDDGTKRSHKGLLMVVEEEGKLKCLQNITMEEFLSSKNMLKKVY